MGFKRSTSMKQQHCVSCSGCVVYLRLVRVCRLLEVSSSWEPRARRQRKQENGAEPFCKAIFPNTVTKKTDFVSHKGAFCDLSFFFPAFYFLCFFISAFFVPNREGFLCNATIFNCQSGLLQAAVRVSSVPSWSFPSKVFSVEIQPTEGKV